MTCFLLLKLDCNVKDASLSNRLNSFSSNNQCAKFEEIV